MEGHNAGGYDYTFISDVADDLTCITCHLVMKDPVLAVDCGHKFCQLCFDGLKEDSVIRGTDLICPLDQDVIDPNKEHIEKECAYNVLKCEYHGCEVMTQQRFCADHDTSCSYGECTQAKEIKKLSAVIVEISTNMERALKENKDLTAGFNDQINQLRLQLKERDERLEALERKLNEHDEMLIKFKDNLEEVNKSPESSAKERHGAVNTEQHIKEFEHVFSKQESQTKTNGSSVAAMEIKMFKMNEKTADIKEEGGSIFIKTKLDKMEKMMEEADQKLKEQDSKIEKGLAQNIDLASQFQSLRVSKDMKLIGYFQWSVARYSKKCLGHNDSVPFYTLNGYKCALRIEWSGSDGENFGLYIRLHPGERDEGLVWPFNCKVTFETVSKSNISYKKCLDRNMSLELPWRQKPKRSSNIPWGFGKYLSKPKIDDFVINDRIIISCYIEMM